MLSSIICKNEGNMFTWLFFTDWVSLISSLLLQDGKKKTFLNFKQDNFYIFIIFNIQQCIREAAGFLWDVPRLSSWFFETK